MENLEYTEKKFREIIKEKEDEIKKVEEYLSILEKKESKNKKDLRRISFTKQKIKDLRKITDYLNSLIDTEEENMSAGVFVRNNKSSRKKILIREYINEEKSKRKKNITKNISTKRYKNRIPTKSIKEKSGKPKILLITDVEGWAWWIKSRYLIRYLSDEFDFDIYNYLEDGKTAGINNRFYDIYFTFGYSYITKINNVEKKKRVTGVTAHRNPEMIRKRMRLAGHIHANSVLLYNELVDMGFSDNLYYVPNGVDEELFNIKKYIPRERNKIVVGHVGKLSPRKGQKDFIIPAIERADADSRLHLNDYTNRLPHDKMPDLYQDMDVFIVSSDEDGTPNPALEAAACGRPIISNRIGNMPEFIKDGYNGFLVDRNINAYVEKINWLKNNRDKLIEMGINARKTVEDGWTWKIQSENYRKMFRSILEKNENYNIR